MIYVGLVQFNIVCECELCDWEHRASFMVLRQIRLFSAAVFVLSGMERYTDRSVIPHPHTAYRVSSKLGLILHVKRPLNGTL